VAAAGRPAQLAAALGLRAAQQAVVELLAAKQVVVFQGRQVAARQEVFQGQQAAARQEEVLPARMAVLQVAAARKLAVVPRALAAEGP
jgi:hypothetical protein